MASDDKTLIEILEENIPIDILKYIAYVSAPQAGAVATFSGTTRDSFEGKKVVELRYEAYVPMAIRCIKTICASARSSWSLHSIAVAHRLGPVPVGETSVFIAISAVHRADGLEACQFVIDELKASVPIWKKEVYDNGEVWKENSEFIDRRLELGKKEGDHNGIEVEVPRATRKSCCGSKVKVNEESECIGIDRRLELEKKEDCNEIEVEVPRPSRKGCCGSKVKVNEESKCSGIDLEKKEDRGEIEVGVPFPRPSRKNCCGHKVKVNEEFKCTGIDHEGNNNNKVD